jgi:hypothetical protein
MGDIINYTKNNHIKFIQRKEVIKGKNQSHIIIIKESYRFRGNEARAHTKKKRGKIKKWGVLKNRKLREILKKQIKEYSPRNKRTKLNEENSVLNPLTNSDSPSTKSKGVRLVSAKMMIIRTGRILHIKIVSLIQFVLSMLEIEN